MKYKHFLKKFSPKKGGGPGAVDCALARKLWDEYQKDVKALRELRLARGEDPEGAAKEVFETYVRREQKRRGVGRSLKKTSKPQRLPGAARPPMPAPAGEGA